MNKKSKAYKYYVYGIHLESEIECPELMESHEEPEVKITLGLVPELIEQPVRKTPLSEVKPGYFLIKVPNVADYYITGGNSIVVNIQPDGDLAGVKTYLLGSALAGVLVQRGLFPFHGSAVTINGKTIIICGNSGDGKSTLAAELNKRGHAFISDDVSVITISDMGKPIVHPGYANIRLWKNSLNMLDVSSENLDSVRKDINKFNLGIDGNVITKVTEVHSIYFLDKKNRVNDFQVSQVDGIDKFAKLRLATFRKNLLKGHGKFEEHFKLCNDIINHCKLYQLSRNPSVNTVEAIADYLENQVSHE